MQIRAIAGLPALLGLAFALRLLFPIAMWLIGGDRLDFLSPDTPSYLRPAIELARHGAFYSLGLPELERTPGYPLLLSLGVLSGHVIATAVALQILLSTATVALVYALGLQLFANRRIALVGAAIYAFEPLSILFASKLLSETLFAFWLTLFVWLVLQYLESTREALVSRVPPLAWLVSAALTLAAAAYTRPIAYYLPAAALVYFAGLALARRSARPLLHGLLFFAVSFAPMMAWTQRNAALTGYHGFSAIADVNLYYYRAAAVVARVTHQPFHAVQAAWGYGRRPRRLPQFPAYAGWSEARCYPVMRQEALEVLKAHPATYLSLHVSGLFRFVAFPGGSDYTRSFHLFPRGETRTVSRFMEQGILRTAADLYQEYPAQIWANLSLGALLFATYLAAFLGLTRRRSTAGPAALIFLGLLGLYLVAIAGGPEAVARFRHPLMPFVAVFAGSGVVAMWQRKPRPERST